MAQASSLGRGAARLRLPSATRLVAALLVLGACGEEAGAPPPHLRVAGGAPERGREALRTHACGSCHVIPGLRGAVAWVGPPLTEWARRGYVAGRLPNTPENLVPWLVDPQAVSPGSAMPNLGVTEAEARDMAAYLYTLGAARAQAVPAGMPLAPGQAGPREDARMRPREAAPVYGQGRPGG